MNLRDYRHYHFWKRFSYQVLPDGISEYPLHLEEEIDAHFPLMSRSSSDAYPDDHSVFRSPRPKEFGKEGIEMQQIIHNMIEEAGSRIGRTRAAKNKMNYKIGNKEKEVLIKMIFPSTLIKRKKRGRPSHGSQVSIGSSHDASCKPAEKLRNQGQHIKRQGRDFNSMARLSRQHAEESFAFGCLACLSMRNRKGHVDTFV